MADNLPTVWRAEPHTVAKHALLRNYLDAWFPILTRQAARLQQSNREILFVDAFAGPGEYTNEVPGSPVIAIRAVREHAVQFPYPVRLYFNELDGNRFHRLQEVIASEREAAAGMNEPILQPATNLDSTAALEQLLDHYDQRNATFGPALVFLDQFGYSAVPMDLVARIMSHSECEVFTLLDFREMSRWIGDPTKSGAFTRAFGGDEWAACRDMPERRLRECLLDRYLDALRSRANVRYATSFAMFDTNDRMIYRLVFCTNSLRGLEVMKTAMWRVDDSGEGRFSDNDTPGQVPLLSVAFDQAWLAQELRRRLRGKTMTVAEVKKFVLVETPCRLFKGALQQLERDGEIHVGNASRSRRRGSFPEDLADELTITFPQSLF